MRAIIKKEPKRGLWMEDVPPPVCGGNDILITIKKTAICGTDLHIYQWDDWAQKTIPVPMVIGHEFCGEVAEVGALVNGFKVGDRVSGEGHLTCSYCRNCRAGKRHLCRNTLGVGVHRQGAFAQSLVIPASNGFKVPDQVSDEVAAIFDPFGNAAHTALSFDLVGEDVLITGAGAIGMMATAIAKHVGARHIVVSDVNDKRLQLAKKMGASCTINPKHESLKNAMDRLGMKEGFDIGLEMSGNSGAFISMIEHLNHGARIGLLGIFPNNVEVDWSDFIFKGLTLKGIYGREVFETWYKMASMLETGLDISPVLTHQLKADDFESGFELLEKGEAVKVILDWT